MEDVFADLPHDPRDPANAALRASDRDRDAVLRVLGDAYADGRLTRDELDERTDQVAQARTLGDLPPFLDDLVPRTPARVPAPSGLDIQAEAERRVRHQRREAVWGALSASTICIVIWALTMFGGFFWPAFVVLGTGMNAGRVIWQRRELVDEEVRRLEKQERAELEQRRPPADGEDGPRDPAGPGGG